MKDAKKLKEVKKIALDIKMLKIQGASKVLLASIKAIGLSIQALQARNAEEFKKALKKQVILIARLRATEPGVRNFARYLLMRVFSSKEADLNELRKYAFHLTNNYLKEKDALKKLIFEYGARKIPNDSIVLTHCHSNTVEGVLKQAWKNKTKFEVIATESRPLYQGHITANNLSKAGIPVTLIIDSAVSSVVHDADLFLTGCDAILADGSLVNKIGTRTISMICDAAKVPHFVATASYKFDPITYFGYEELIEERDWREVWPDKPKKVKVINHAFDVTEANSIQAYITEKGVFAPQALPFVIFEEMQLAKNKEELSLIKALIGKK